MTVEVVFFAPAAVCHWMPDRTNCDAPCGATYRTRERDTLTRAPRLVTCPDCLRAIADTAADRPGTLCGCNRAGSCEHCYRIGQHLNRD